MALHKWQSAKAFRSTKKHSPAQARSGWRVSRAQWGKRARNVVIEQTGRDPVRQTAHTLSFPGRAGIKTLVPRNKISK